MRHRVARTRRGLTVQFRVLGPVEIRHAGVCVSAGPPQQRAVLAALLADAGRPVSTKALLRRVWGDEPPARSARTLHTHLAALRRLCKDLDPDRADGVIVRRPGGYVVHVDPHDVDLFEFRHRVHSGSLADALALWTDEPLTGVPGAWAEQVRHTWLDERDAVVARWAALELAAGRAGQTVVRLTELTAGRPLSEPLVLATMRALRAEGRSAEALRRYATLRRALAEELGADPDPELQAMHVTLLRDGARAAVQPPPPQLPPPQPPAFDTAVPSPAGAHPLPTERRAAEAIVTYGARLPLAAAIAATRIAHRAGRWMLRGTPPADPGAR